jgi:transcriptional regulator GlxA family with amidase domain
LPKPLYKNRPNLVFTRIEGYIDKGGMRTGFGMKASIDICLALIAAKKTND